MPITIGFDDGVFTQTGELSWDGTSNGLQGIDIDLFTIDGTNTPLNSGAANALDCRDCLLNFTTGDYIGLTGNDFTFGQGGNFTITGSAYDPLNNLVASGTLLDGLFDLVDPKISLAGSIGLFVGLGIDEKNADLLNYFGAPSGDYTYANTEIALGTCSGGVGGIDCIVTNADVDNVYNQVPEPSALALMGLGLLGLIGMRRRSA